MATGAAHQRRLRDPFGAELYDTAERATSPTPPPWPASGAATPPRSPISGQVRRCSISGPAAGSTSCVRAAGRPDRPGDRPRHDPRDARARAPEAADAGATNVEFVEGTIEAIPLPSSSVDVVISNCVINLAADKSAVLDEIARVLRPGGRMGVSDVVARDDLTPDQRAERGSFAGCIAGALSFEEYERGLTAAGLIDVLRPSDPRGRRRDVRRDRQSDETCDLGRR